MSIQTFEEFVEEKKLAALRKMITRIYTEDNVKKLTTIEVNNYKTQIAAGISGDRKMGCVSTEVEVEEEIWEAFRVHVTKLTK